MNPAVLNYLQSQQQPNQNMEQAPQQQAPYNPFDSGINKAISSARESLGMTDKQQEKALRRSMLTFGDNIAQQPKQKGFWNNFGSVGRALSPAIMAHDDAEDAALTQNNALANQMLAYQAAEQNRQSQEEEKAWRRQHAEAQLGEQRRAHDMMNSLRTQRSHPTGSIDDALLENKDYIPIVGRSERTPYVKDKKAFGQVLGELSSIQKDYNKFKDLAKDDLIHPMAPYGMGKAANATKDFFGYFSKKKGLREETKLRQGLNAKLEGFIIEADQKLKGGGVLSESMRKTLENKAIFPSLRDTPDVFEEKLNDLTKKMEERYKTSVASLKYGVHLNPSDLDEIENSPLQGQDIDINSGESGQNFILMQDQSGQQYSIPRDEVEDAINDGLTPIGQ